MTLGSQTRYRCQTRGCGFEKFIPGQPPHAPRLTIRTGCEHCQRITTFAPVGSVVGR